MTSLSKSRTILDLFPIPEFLLLSTAGIAINDYDMKFVELHREVLGDGFKLTHSSQVTNPEGAIIGGVINNPSDIAGALKSLALKYKLRYVHGILPEEKAYIFTSTIDWVPREDRHDAVAFIVEENAPVSLADAVFSYEVIKNDKEAKKIKVAVSVLSKDVVESYTTLFESVGIAPVSFDLESQAVARAVVSCDDKNSYLIVSLSPKKTGLYVIEAGVVVFSTTLSYGIGVGGADNFGDIRDEIRKVLAFWDIQNGKSAYPAEKVEKVIFAGYKSNEKELANKLLEDTNLYSTVGDVWLNLSDSSRKNVSDEVFEKSLEYVTAIGAALTCEH